MAIGRQQPSSGTCVIHRIVYGCSTAADLDTQTSRPSGSPGPQSPLPARRPPKLAGLVRPQASDLADTPTVSKSCLRRCLPVRGIESKTAAGDGNPTGGDRPRFPTASS